MEVNASDTRNKADSKRKDGIAGKTSNRVKELVTNSCIGVRGATESAKQVLIMDEVDGMSGALLRPGDHASCRCCAHRTDNGVPSALLPSSFAPDLRSSS